MRGRRKGEELRTACLIYGGQSHDEAGRDASRCPLVVTGDASGKKDDEEKGGEEGEENEEGEHRREERVHSKRQEVKGERCRRRHASEHGRCQAF